MHGCARGPPPEGRWGGRSNPPLTADDKVVIAIKIFDLEHRVHGYMGTWVMYNV